MIDEPPVARWVCPNCGQITFGDDLPDLCDYCGDFTTWKPAPPLSPQHHKTPSPDDDKPTQPRLF